MRNSHDNATLVEDRRAIADAIQRIDLANRLAEEALGVLLEIAVRRNINLPLSLSITVDENIA